MPIPFSLMLSFPQPGSQSNVNEKIGPRVEIGKADADDAEDANAHVMPLDFLLGVMRDPNTPSHLRLRAAGIVAPFVHSKGEPPRRMKLQAKCGSLLILMSSM